MRLLHLTRSTPPARSRPRSPRRTGARLATLVAAIVGLALGGCALVDVGNLGVELEDEGFRDVTTTVQPESVLVVKARSPSGLSTEQAQDEAAKIVWERFPRSFDALRLTIDGDARSVTYAELEDELGPRPAGLDEEGDVGDDINRAVLTTVIVIAVAGLLFVLFAGVVTILVIRRSRRRRERLPRPAPWAPPIATSPYAPPPHAAPTPPPATGPVPPAEGWGAASGSTPPPVPQAAWTPIPRPAPRVDLRKRPVETRADRRRLGRRPRGPLPDAAHTPPGWD